MSTTNELGTKKIGKLLMSLAIPAIIAMIVNLLYNMVDRIYIGNMTNGTLGMAGLSVAVPVITLIMAFTMLFGSGGAPLAAIKLGEGKKDEAERIMTTSFSSLIICAILLTVMIELFQEPLLYMFGADSTSIAPAKEYICIYALGTLFVQITQGMNAYINTQGYAKVGMCTVLIGAVVNIVLDPIFIFVLNMGVSGAALATVLSQGLSALWVMYFFLKISPLKIRKEYLLPNLKVLGSIMMLGISPFIMNATEGLLQISFNNQLSLYGGSMAVASMSILMSLYQIITMPLQGVSQGAQPILSYNYGAKDYDRVKETFRLTFKICVGYSIITASCIVIFSNIFAGFFSNDPTTITFTSWAIRVYLVGAVLFGAQIACQQSFMALGQAKRSLLMALFRKVVLLIPLIYILPTVLGETSIAWAMSKPVTDITVHSAKTFCVLLAEPISDILTACTTTCLFMNFYKKYLNKDET